ncbi:MAG: NAD(P)/FAD-dependent oxidoreductase [Bryobacteraceae bacterium]|jgi:digeranylgeranylglycerophospholipid reductase
MSGYEAIVAGGGPAGLSVAEAIASRGRSVLVLEQNHEIGSPIRTSGGSFVSEMQALGIPAQFYHPIHRVRFLSPHNSAMFDYDAPELCVMDVRGVFQFLAERAVAAGAHMRLSTAALAPVMDGDAVTGVQTRTSTLSCQVLIDATGYRSSLLKQVKLDPGFRRFGVGAEYDLFAPHCDPSEAILVVGNDAAPSGYGWIFPWGRGRVRVGVGIIHPDSAAKPDLYLDRFLETLPRYGVNMKGAQPLEHHSGLIPSERFASTFAGDGVLAVGDAAGQASSLLGEGIRWAIRAGRMAGEVVAHALSKGEPNRVVPRLALLPFEQQWRKQFGADLRLAHRINQRIARWDDRKWDARTEIVKLLTPAQFAEALKTNLTGAWLWRFLVSHPQALAYAAGL